MLQASTVLINQGLSIQVKKNILKPWGSSAFCGPQLKPWPGFQHHVCDKNDTPNCFLSGIWRYSCFCHHAAKSKLVSPTSIQDRYLGRGKDLLWMGHLTRPATRQPSDWKATFPGNKPSKVSWCGSKPCTPGEHQKSVANGCSSNMEP